MIWPRPTQDRRRAGTAWTLLVAVLLGVSFHSALMTLPIVSSGRVFVNVAVLTGVLAVFGLRSVPLRAVVLCYASIGAVLMAAMGTLGDGTGLRSARYVVLWVATTVAALVLCPTPTRSQTAAPAGSEDVDVISPKVGSLARGVVGAVMIVLAGTLVAGPWAARWANQRPAVGDRPDTWAAGPGNAMSYQDRLDMTRRPRLSDDVVMTVRSDLTSFWRTATYDRWDRSAWTRSDAGAYRDVAEDGVITAAPDDLAATAGVPSTQQFHIQGRYTSAVPVAASAELVRTSARLLQLPDGSLVAPEGVGRGADYTVTSRQVRTTTTELAGIDASVPVSVMDRYGVPLPTTERVRTLADGIVHGAGASNEYAKVHALERWMGENLTYSLDAPLAQRGVDVVDHFLFDSKQGWCEQIASSLVVMARQVGVPARLATGFAPGEYDDVNGRFVVRERDAHAWAEVWFPGVGWIPFDPTATVPLAGEPGAARAGGTPIGFAAVAGILVFVGLVTVVAAPLARRLHRWREGRARARAARRLADRRWDVRVEQELEELGRELGRVREPSETVTAHARELAAVSGRADLADQGRAVDEYRYGPPGSGHDAE